MKNGQYKEAAKQLKSVLNLLPIWEQYNEKKGNARKAFSSDHEGDLLAYEHAQKQLQKSAVNSTVDPDKVVVLISHVTGQIEAIRKQSNEIDNSVKVLQSAQKKVEAMMPRNKYRTVEAGKKKKYQQR